MRATASGGKTKSRARAPATIRNPIRDLTALRMEGPNPRLRRPPQDCDSRGPFFRRYDSGATSCPARRSSSGNACGPIDLRSESVSDVPTSSRATVKRAVRPVDTEANPFRSHTCGTNGLGARLPPPNGTASSHTCRSVASRGVRPHRERSPGKRVGPVLGARRALGHRSVVARDRLQRLSCAFAARAEIARARGGLVSVRRRCSRQYELGRAEGRTHDRELAGALSPFKFVRVGAGTASAHHAQLPDFATSRDRAAPNASEHRVARLNRLRFLV